MFPLGHQLQRVIRDRGLRQADVARKLGIDPSTFSKRLTGADPCWPEGYERQVSQAIEDVAQDYQRRLRGEFVSEPEPSHA